MSNKLETLDSWHKTRLGLLIFGLAELAIAYGLASWAIDSGSLLAYTLTLLFFIGSLTNLSKGIAKSIQRHA